MLSSEKVVCSILAILVALLVWFGYSHGADNLSVLLTVAGGLVFAAPFGHLHGGRSVDRFERVTISVDYADLPLAVEANIHQLPEQNKPPQGVSVPGSPNVALRHPGTDSAIKTLII
jgi:hypothetical protein